MFDDGRADGYEAKASVVHRDLRLDFYRDAFRSARLKAKWFIGYRRVTHRRSMDSEYYALAPNLPPLLDPLTTPRADLIPTPDFSTTYSDVEVRGAQAGLEVTMPVFKDKVHFDAGFTLAVLRGRETTEYVGLTYGYARLEGTDVAEFLEPPFDELNLFEDPDNPGTGAPVDDIQQVLIPVSLDQTNDSTDSQILETFLGLRWRAWRNLEVSLGFRNARYDDIGVETYPRDDDGTNVQRETFSVNFEGYYLGAAYRW